MYNVSYYDFIAGTYMFVQYCVPVFSEVLMCLKLFNPRCIFKFNLSNLQNISQASCVLFLW